MRTKTIFDRTFDEYSGVLHVHTQYSFDCDVALPRIIRAAKKSRADFIMINDHHTFAAKDDHAVRNEKELIILAGAELNDKSGNNHYLVFGTDQVHTKIPAQEYMQQYANEGIHGFIAHPRERRRTKRYRKYPWTERNIEHAAGMEIWNFTSSWMGKLIPSINALPMLLFPGCFVRRPLPENLRLWDDWNLEGKRLTGIGSADVHGTRMKMPGFKFRVLSHERLMGKIRTNVLLKQGEKPEPINLYRALLRGNCYAIYEPVGAPFNFYAGIVDRDGNGAIYGEDIDLQPGLTLFFNLPMSAKVKLIHNGRKIAHWRDQRGSYPIKQPGFYRLEITRYGKGWIYTNPIYVNEPKTQ